MGNLCGGPKPPPVKSSQKLGLSNSLIQREVGKAAYREASDLIEDI